MLLFATPPGYLKIGRCEAHLSLRVAGFVSQSAAETTRAGASNAVAVFVREPVDDAIGLIEAGSDDVHVLGIAAVIASENGIRDVIGELNQARCARVDEEWRVGDILQGTPPGAYLAKFPAQLLKRGLARRFVRNNHPALLVTLLPAVREEIIKSLAEILEG